MAADAANVQGLREFREELKKLDGDWPKQLTQANRKIASNIQGKARSNASQAGGPFAASRTAIRGQGYPESAAIGVSQSGRNPFAAATFWGAKKRTGWYAAGQYEGGPPQFPEWVGNQWDAASFTQGPYVINYTIAEELPEALKVYEQTVEDIAAAAFPK